MKRSKKVNKNYGGGLVTLGDNIVGFWDYNPEARWIANMVACEEERLEDEEDGEARLELAFELAEFEHAQDPPPADWELGLEESGE